MSVSNEVLNVAINANDLRAYESLGFDTTSFQNYDESFSLNINKPIPMVQYRDSNTWAKYCPRLIKLDFYKKCQIKKDLHGTLCSRMIEFLQTDIAETPTSRNEIPFPFPGIPPDSLTFLRLQRNPLLFYRGKVTARTKSNSK